ncbi:MAG: hypothetical protein IK072_01940 [Clostridia bacterium]|nr:hypothetical protein [Clostridia bacterium]
MAENANGVEISSLSLKIKSDSEGAIKGLEKLKETLGKLKASANTSFMGVNKIKKLSDSLLRLRDSAAGIRLGAVASGLNKVGQAISSLGSNLDNLSKLARMLESIKSASASMPLIGGGAKSIADSVNKYLLSELGKIQSSMTQENLAGGDISGGIKKSLGPLKQFNEELGENAKKSSGMFAFAIEKVKSSLGGMSPAADTFKRSISSIAQPMKSIGGRIANIFSYRAIRFAMHQITQAFKEGINNAYEYSKAVGGSFSGSMDRLATSALYLKNSLGGLLAPLVASLAPVVEWIIDKISIVLNYVNQFVSALSGKTTWLKAKEYSVQYANSATKAGKAAANAGKSATKSANQVANAVKKATLGIDELNMIEKKKSGKASGGGSGIGGGGGINTPDYSKMFEEIPIDSGILNMFKSNLFEIRALVDAALFTIGAVLLFSGHPLLGIGLMIYAGADYVKNVSENWDYVKQKLQGPMGIFASIAGATAILLGSVLLFSGNPLTMGLGLGLIFMGASSIALSISANWDYIQEKLKGPLGTFTKIAGAVAVLFGTLLLFSGNPLLTGLGFGLLLLGLGGIALAVTADWGWAPNKIGSILKDIVAILGAVGVAAIGIGILLCCAQIWGLGLGMIASGAAMVFSALSFNPQGFANVLGSIGKWIAKKVVGWLGRNSGARMFVGLMMMFCGKFEEGAQILSEAGLDFLTHGLTGYDPDKFADRVIGPLENTLEDLGIVTSKAGDKVKSASEVFKEAGEKIPNNFNEGFKSGAEQTKMQLASWSDNLQKWTITEKVNEDFKSAGEKATSSFNEGFKSGAKEISGQKVAEGFANSGLKEGFKGAGEKATSSFNSGVEDSFPGGRKILEDWGKKAKVWFEGSGKDNIGNKFNDTGSGVVDKFDEGIESSKPISQDAMSQWSSSLDESFKKPTGGKNIFERFLETGKGMWESLKSGIAQAVKASGNFFSWLGNTVSDWLKPIADGFVQSGRDCFGGYLKGFEKKAKDPASAALLKKYAKSALASFNEGVKVESPSKLFMKSGEYSVEGYNLGIEKEMGTTENLLRTFGESLGKYLSPTLGIGVDSSELKYGLEDYSKNVSAEVNSKSKVSVEGIKEGIEQFFKEEILPLVGQMAVDVRRQADKEEKTVLEIDGAVVGETITRKQEANGYVFAR